MPFRKSISLAIVTSMLLTGCSFVDRWVYRPDINQGNYVTKDAIELLQVGQSKEQVVFIMGSPMLTSSFGDNVWYYVFRQQPRHGNVSQITYAVYFDGMGVVSDIKTSTLEGSLSLEEMNKQEISDPIDIKSEDDNDNLTNQQSSEPESESE
ncbi:outer membrane protein assembly factor BamE [Gilliamella sp. B14384H2]|uniref:outer membrane protein assembly factor BamE n=1 Tax=unclassified Gilliamella TaxID=2685620 RepID=UPI0018DC23DD|nr:MULTISPECIES: outer membrane protein assembly factor BamE [unclassified Gilliamella]MBI0036806.1 outer membrane protein assembly factor BamE [Gilliamella sp. B14384G10]MBI0039540.1 outer membrane protein assembly factor BamE [Gilliamella sp. B14384G7]MBI0050801.1 outer membrane protein assembly factor BamE [Gilliamella sp. B14384G13]MBI0053093.1 outer membrane protein assembly factor BamE [Gilliamella sp. B14384H2]